MAGYKTLFNVNLQHSFFNENQCRVLSILPTNFTQSFFHKADLVFNTFKQGITISYNTDFTASLEAYLDDNIILSFIIKSTDPFFYSYTDLKHLNGKSLYFDSELTHEKGEILILSKEDFVTANDERIITDKVFDDVFTKVDKTSTPLGVINIRLANLISGDEIIEPYISREYIISFKARSTFWRYNFIKKNDIEYDELLIQDIDNKLEFNNGIKVSLSNGVLANQIISKQPIKIREFSDYQLNLVGIKNNQIKVLIKRLSIPDAKQIIIEKEKMISELYVYY